MEDIKTLGVETSILAQDIRIYIFLLQTNNQITKVFYNFGEAYDELKKNYIKTVSSSEDAENLKIEEEGFFNVLEREEKITHETLINRPMSYYFSVINEKTGHKLKYQIIRIPIDIKAGTEIITEI